MAGRLTKEEKAERVEKLRQRIGEGVADLAQSGQWERYLNFMARFHTYSISNQLLIMLQSQGEATLVAGFRQWRERGRQVRKGEHGMQIIGHSTVVVKDDDGKPVLDEDGNEIHKVWWPVLTVFDIGQTDPIEGMEQPLEAVMPKPLEGTEDKGITRRMTQWLDAQGWTVTREAMGGGVKGYTLTDGSNRIALNKANSPLQDAKTILHETAHMLLHNELPEGEYGEHRGIYETEAESVAYVVASWAGLDVSAYSVPYVAGWSRMDADTIKATALHVREASCRIIDALEEHDRS